MWRTTYEISSKYSSQVQRAPLTDVICALLSGIPTITLFRHARIANIALALEHRTICPAGLSCKRLIISSRSMEFVVSRCDKQLFYSPFEPKTVSLLIGFATSLRWLICSSEDKYSDVSNLKPFFSSMSKFSIATSSSAAVNSKISGLTRFN
jgi:hypothetical protein